MCSGSLNTSLTRGLYLLILPSSPLRPSTLVRSIYSSRGLILPLVRGSVLPLARREPVEGFPEEVRVTSRVEMGTAPIPAPRDGAEELGGAAPGPRGRETGYAARSEACEDVSVGGGVVFADFGRSKVYALTNDGDEVLVFKDLIELAKRLQPSVVVIDSVPRTQQRAAEELAKKGD